MKTNFSIIFLDIDGVLCTRQAAGWTRAGGRLVKGLRMRMPARAVDARAVARLNALVAASNALVVVTSMWRIDRDVPSLLKRVGFAGAFHADWRTVQREQMKWRAGSLRMRTRITC